MKRRINAPMSDHRADWQIAQAAKCGCRGTDDLCVCQNANEPWKYGLGPRPSPTPDQRAIETREAVARPVTRADVADIINRRYVGNISEEVAVDRILALLPQSTLTSPLQDPPA